MFKPTKPRFQVIEYAPIINWNTDAIVGNTLTVVKTVYTRAYADKLAIKLNDDLGYHDADTPYYVVKDTKPSPRIMTDWHDTIGLPF